MADGLPTFPVTTKPLTGQAFFESPKAIMPRGREQAEDVIEQQELLAEQERELEAQRLQEEISSRRQQLLAQQTARGITGGLAAAQQQELEERAGLALDEKTQRDLIEKEFARKEKRQSLRQAFASQMLRQAQRQHQVNFNKFQRAFSRFRRTTAGKMIEEQEVARDRLQADYDNAVANLSRGIEKRRAVSGILGALSGLAGLATGGVGAIVGGALTGAVSGIGAAAGRGRASDVISQFRSG
jgi:hypothetical protein